jgi:hypothetical protein
VLLLVISCSFLHKCIIFPVQFAEMESFPAMSRPVAAEDSIIAFIASYSVTLDVLRLFTVNFFTIKYFKMLVYSSKWLCWGTS